jgi:hypothetical protein
MHASKTNEPSVNIFHFFIFPQNSPKDQATEAANIQAIPFTFQFLVCKQLFSPHAVVYDIDDDTKVVIAQAIELNLSSVD